MKKQHIYTLEQINQVYSYLMTKPMAEVEKFVTILRSPVKVVEEQSQQEPALNVETKEKV